MTMGGARGLSADQLLSAVGLESPLRPEAPGMFDDTPPTLPTPPTTEPLTLKPVNWNSRGGGVPLLINWEQQMKAGSMAGVRRLQSEKRGDKEKSKVLRKKE